MKWNDIESLPMNKEQIKKILILTEGRRDKSLHVCTNYWHVFFDNRNFEFEDLYDKKVKINDNCYSYGRFGERTIPIEKIKAWMHADELINLYNNENNKN